MNDKTNIAQLRQQASLPAKEADAGTLGKFFAANKKTIQAVLPSHLDANRMLRIGLTAINKVPKLKECTVESLFGAVVQCSTLGLEPNTVQGHAHLIPFRNTKQNKTEVQLIIGYRGLIDLARRSGQIVSIAAHAVRANDEFEYEYGLDEKLVHRPGEGDRGEITHFYAVAKLVGGGHAFEVMSRAGVIQIRDNTQNWKTAVKYNSTAKNIWTLHFEEMGRKTLIRRLYKYLPTSIEMAKAGILDEKATAGEAQDMGSVLEGDYNLVPEDEVGGQMGSDADVETPGNNVLDDEWPKFVKGSGWTDSAGEVYHEQHHGMGKDGVPAVKKDGTFKAKRGSGKAGSGTGQAPAEFTLESLTEKMKAAETVDDLDVVMDLQSQLKNPDDRVALEGIYNSRRAQLEGNQEGGGFDDVE